MEVQRVVVGARDVGRMVINVSVPRVRLRKTHFGNYVAYAERQGWHTGSTIASRARTRPWYDLGLRVKSERSDIIWSKGQQYRHVVPLNIDKLPVNCALYDLWSRNNRLDKLLWAILNSTFVALSKHQFARSAGVEGNVQTDVVSVNMMLVPDIRRASSEAADRAVAACDRMCRRSPRRYLYEEFTLQDRRDLDDATFEILGIENPDERMALRDRLYRDVTDLQQAIRDREIIAQRDRRRPSQRATSSPQTIAEDLWLEHESSLNLLQFPEDFVTAPGEGSHFDLPAGEVQVGEALIAAEGMLRAGTVRVGGRDGEVVDVEAVSRAMYLQALAQCHRFGRVRLPTDDVCQEAVRTFRAYYRELTRQCARLAEQRTSDQRRQRGIGAVLLRKALQWKRR